MWKQDILYLQPKQFHIQVKTCTSEGQYSIDAITKAQFGRRTKSEMCNPSTLWKYKKTKEGNLVAQICTATWCNFSRNQFWKYNPWLVGTTTTVHLHRNLSKKGGEEGAAAPNMLCCWCKARYWYKGTRVVTGTRVQGCKGRYKGTTVQGCKGRYWYKGTRMQG